MFKFVLNMILYFLILVSFVFAINGDWVATVSFFTMLMAIYQINYGD